MRSTPPFTPNWDRSVTVFSEMAGKWGSNSFAFQHMEPPERLYRPQFVESGSLEHAWWLFFTGWLNRQGFTAKQVFTGAQYIFGEYGTDLVNPDKVAELPVKAYEDIKMIVPYGQEEPWRVDVWWRGCLEVLRDEFQSDPRNIMLSLEHGRSAMELRHELMRRFKLFKGKGIGHKIAQLIICWFQEAEWAESQEEWLAVRRIPVVAVDLWWMRMVYQLGLIQEFRSDITTKISSPIADFACQVCHEADISHNHLAQAIWHTAMDYCARARRRHVKDRPYRHICAHCPAHEYCLGVVPANSHQVDIGGGRTRKVVHADIGWTKFQPHPKGVAYNYALPL